MKRLFGWAIGLSAVAGAILALWVFADPAAREVRRIEGRLKSLASEVSFSDKNSALSRLGYADGVVTYFTDPTDLDISLGSRHARGAMNMGELREGATGMRVGSRGLSVTFLDIAVELEGAAGATAHLTSKIYFHGEPDYWVQEFRLKLEKSKGTWLIRGISTVRTMEQ